MSGLIKLVLFMLVACALIEMTWAECCQHTGRGTCCGLGRCNLFCCNCDRKNINGKRYTCKPKGKCSFNADTIINLIATGASLAALGKRDVSSLEMDVVPSEPKDFFNALDLNKDGTLCIKETTQYLLQSHGNDSFIRNNPNWFKELDTNNDNVIQIYEFDHDQSDEKEKSESTTTTDAASIHKSLKDIVLDKIAKNTDGSGLETKQILLSILNMFIAIIEAVKQFISI